MKHIFAIIKYGLSYIHNKIRQIRIYFENNICRITHKAPKIMSKKDTIEYILNKKCSVSRFGDGEIALIAGIDQSFQQYSNELGEKLERVLNSNSDDLLVCIPSCFTKKQLDDKSERSVSFWKRHLNHFRKVWYKSLNKNQLYGDTQISRPYMFQKDKTNVGDFFLHFKKLWDEQDVLLVEGEKSRLGVGNDLFDNAISVKRILGPAGQSFDKYDELLFEIKKTNKDTLILLAMGPTASLLAYDLSLLGYQAIDIGNIDTEYEWFKMKAQKKQKLKNKLNYEVASENDIEDIDDEKYAKEIIAKII